MLTLVGTMPPTNTKTQLPSSQRNSSFSHRLCNITIGGVPLFNRDPLTNHAHTGDEVDSCLLKSKPKEAPFQLMEFINGTLSLEKLIDTTKITLNNIPDLTSSSEKIKKIEKSVINRFERVIVIGDSLSDSKGRMLKKTGGWLPSAPQYVDGRFTNGFTWAEFLTSPSLMKVKTTDKTNENKNTVSSIKLKGGQSVHLIQS